MPSLSSQNTENYDALVLESADIQGIIISGYGKLNFSAYLFLQITNPVKGQLWLNYLLEHITSAGCRNPSPAINLALTYSGLKQLRLPEEALDSFPSEFREGMADPERARKLGDVDLNSPQLWEFGSQNDAGEQTIHALLILQTPSENERHLLCQQHLELIQSLQGISVIRIELGYMPADGKEHFGFQDSISQPDIEGSPKPQNPQQDILKAGEFILGYLNEDLNYPPTSTLPVDYDPNQTLPKLPEGQSPMQRDFGRNGSYLVFRKLQQDVFGFRRYFQDNFSCPQTRELVKAKLVGRWPSGAPLSLAPHQDDDSLASKNDFLFMPSDASGYRCPVGSHIRRMNPRDSLGSDPQSSLKGVQRRRIIRRGALYGPQLPLDAAGDDTHAERGLLFICINADIRRQFEFIQQTWVNNPTFNGLYDERDPLIGSPSGAMTIPQEPVRQKINLPSFVQLKGGGYFFLPSLSALKFLAKNAANNAASP
jgi:Dyp-type peroxidase family